VARDGLLKNPAAAGFFLFGAPEGDAAAILKTEGRRQKGVLVTSSLHHFVTGKSAGLYPGGAYDLPPLLDLGLHEAAKFLR